MGKTQRKEKELQLRREEILDAAEAVFDREGLESATMDMIAKEAEFTKQTLYSYFQGKEEIITAVYLRSAGYLNGCFEKHLKEAEDGSGLQWLEAMETTFMEAARTHPLYIRIIAQFQSKDINDYQSMGIYEAILAENSRLEKMMAACLMRGMEDGSLDKNISLKDALLYMKACISGTLGMAVYTSQFVKTELGVEPLELIKRIMDFALRAFKNNNREK